MAKRKHIPTVRELAASTVQFDYEPEPAPWTAGDALKEYRAGKLEAHPMEIDYAKADFLMRQRLAHDEHNLRQLAKRNVFKRLWSWLRGK